MGQHGVIVGKIQFAWNRGKNWPKDGARELKALVTFNQFETGQVTHKVVVPKRAPVLTVSDCLESSRLLYDDGLADGFVFDLCQGCRIDSGVFQESLSASFTVCGRNKLPT